MCLHVIHYLIFAVEKGGISLQDAYDQLRSVAESHSAVDVPEPFNSDLYVLCAEISFQVSLYS